MKTITVIKHLDTWHACVFGGTAHGHGTTICEAVGDLVLIDPKGFDLEFNFPPKVPKNPADK